MKKSNKVPFRKKLAQMMNIDASVFVPMTRQKGKNKCVQCDFLRRYIIENNDDDQVIDIFTLVVYGTLIFPQSSGYVNAAVVDLIEQIDNQVNPIPIIFVETIRSLIIVEGKSKEALLVVPNYCISGSGVTFGASVKHPSDFA